MREVRKDNFVDLPGGLRGIDDFDAVGMIVGEGEEGGAQTQMERFRFAVEATLRFAATAGIMGGISTYRDQGGIEVQEESQVGHVILGGEQREAFDQFAADAA